VFLAIELKRKRSDDVEWWEGRVVRTKMGHDVLSRNLSLLVKVIDEMFLR